MIKFIFSALLLFVVPSICFAQGRPSKEICHELGQVNEETGEFEGCQSIDSQERIDLKELFNFLIVELDHYRGVESDFKIPAVNVRFNKFNDRILELRASRDQLSDPELVQIFQNRIDKMIRNRDKLHAVDETCGEDDEGNPTSCGSPRDNAKGAALQISTLNQQLNDVEFAISNLP